MRSTYQSTPYPPIFGRKQDSDGISGLQEISATGIRRNRFMSLVSDPDYSKKICKKRAAPGDATPVRVEKPDAASPLRGRRAKEQVPSPSERKAFKFLAPTDLPDDGHGTLVEPVADVVTVELRLATVVPDVGRVRPHAVVRHAQQQGGEDGVGHVDPIHLLDPLRALRGVKEPRKVRELPALSLLNFAQHVAALTIPVGTEVHNLHLNGVWPELAGIRNELHALIIDSAGVGFSPLSVVTFEGLHEAIAAVEQCGRDALAVDHDDEVQQWVVWALDLEACDGAVLADERNRSIHIIRIDTRPGFDHRDFVREWGEPAMDEAEGIVLAHLGEHRFHDLRLGAELFGVFRRESGRIQHAEELNLGSLVHLVKAGHQLTLSFVLAYLIPFLLDLKGCGLPVILRTG